MQTMDAQQIYTSVREYFTRDGARLAQLSRAQAVDKDDPACAYRTPDGRACAVGCLLTDAEHDAMKAEQVTFIREGRETGYLVGTVGNIVQLRSFPARLRKEQAFLGKVQSAHDNAHDVLGFLEHLDQIAREFKLDRPA